MNQVCQMLHAKAAMLEERSEARGGEWLNVLRQAAHAQRDRRAGKRQ